MATFRGVEFKTVDADLKVGRRTVLHEYPQRDVPYTEDLGRRARQFVVEAYVLGSDYVAQRDALIEALEAAGPGELVHPRWGTLQVAVLDAVSVKESPSQNGKASFSITFVEHGENKFPQPTANTVETVEATADAVDAAAEFDFAQEFSVDGPSVLSVQSIKNLAADLLDLVATVRRASSLQDLADTVGAITSVAGNLAALVRTPVLLVQHLRSLNARLLTGLRRPLWALAELQSVFASNVRTGATARSGSSRARSLANDTARRDLQRRLAVSNQARVLAVALAMGQQVAASGATKRTTNATSTTTTTLDSTAADGQLLATSAQATALRDTVLAQIDTELEGADPGPAMARALTLLRAAVVRDVAQRAEYLARASTYTPQAVLPALVVAHRVYQDASRADELVVRNGVRHPAFVPAKALEILL